MERNKSKRGISKLMAGMLAMLLCFATSLTALAGTGGTVASPQTAEFTKTLQYADEVGLTTPNVTFTFDFTKKSKDGVETTEALGAMPAIPAKTLSFSSSDTPTVANNMNQIKKTSGDVLAGLNWTETGIYVYDVKEKTSGFTPGAGETMNYSLAEYKLNVVVAYDSASGKYFVEQTTIDQIKDDAGENGDGKGGANPSDDPYTFLFTNTYTKQGGSTPGTKALTITKTTTGTGSDVSKQFSYSLKADDSVTGVANATYTGTITRAGGGTSTVSLVADGSTASTFTLASGDKIVFDTLPAGTTFTVEETGVSGYKASYTGTTAIGNISGAGDTGENLSTGSQTIGTVDNKVDFTNTYDQSLIPTGILNNIVPVFALIAVAVVAFVAYAAVSRRKASH